jgi:exopolysaccharide production protein ExoQ
MTNMRRSTADSSLGRPFRAARTSNWIDVLARTAFTGFLFLIFVGLEPFAPRDSVAAALLTSGEGDTVRQVTYLISFVVVVGMAFATRGQEIIRAFPLPLAIVLVWCLISASWAVDPGIAVRRLALTAILATCVVAGVEMLGTEKSLKALKFVMTTVLIVNCISIFILPQAVHLPGELEDELAGNWRGLHYHKNIAGPIAALSGLLFLHSALVTHRWRDRFLFIAAIVFLVGTQSKTAIGFFGLSLIISSIYRFVARTQVGRQFFRFIFIAVLVVLTILWFAAYETIADFMSDPTRLTGRVAIWNVAFEYLQNHWLLGAGFGSFWQVGEASPALLTTSEKWLQIVPHSHSGYIETLVTTGVIGLLLSIFAFIVVPLKQVLDPTHGDTELKSLMLAFITFIIFANLLETIFLNRDLPEWMVFLMALTIMHRITVRNTTAAKTSGLGERSRDRASSFE